MQKKFDIPSSLAEQTVPDMRNLPPIQMSVLREPAEPQIPLNAQHATPCVLELFKQRQDNWISINQRMSDNFPLLQLFDQRLTLNDLKNNIHTLQQLIEVLSHYKMSINNRYQLLMALVGIFPDYAHPANYSELLCDEKFMGSVISDVYGLKKMLDTVFPNSPLATNFFEWVKLKSPCLRDIIEGRNTMLARQSLFVQMPPAYYSAQTAKSPFTQENDRIIAKFIYRIERIKKNKLESIKNFENVLFDKDLTVSQLKDSIQNVDDLLDILKKNRLTALAGYTLINYLISRLPLNLNTGNLKAYPCDESFLKKIIGNKEDIQKIYTYINPVYSTRLENRLLTHSPYCKTIIQSIPDITYTNTMQIDLVDNQEQSVIEEQPIIFEPTTEIEAYCDRWDTNRIDKRSIKRHKVNQDIMAIETPARQPVISQNPLGTSASFFALPSYPDIGMEKPVSAKPEEPDGGEFEYVIDENGKMIAIDDLTGFVIG